MRPRLLPLLAALALSASAASGVTLVPDPNVPGQYSASIQATHFLAGGFADTFAFVAPADGLFSFTLDTNEPLGTAGVYFQGYELNALVFFNDLPSHVTVEGIPIAAGPQSLLIGGVAAPALPPRTSVSAGYTGTLIFDVPEPQTWLLMAGGLLALGILLAARLAARRRLV